MVTQTMTMMPSTTRMHFPSNDNTEEISNVVKVTSDEKTKTSKCLTITSDIYLFDFQFYQKKGYRESNVDMGRSRDASEILRFTET